MKGFTLLEVLVALGLLALVLTVLLRMEVSSIAQTSRNSLSFQALAVATDEMDELISRPIIGEYTNDRDPYQVSAEVQEHSESGVRLEVKTVNVGRDGVQYAQIKSFVVKIF